MPGEGVVDEGVQGNRPYVTIFRIGADDRQGLVRNTFSVSRVGGHRPGAAGFFLLAYCRASCKLTPGNRSINASNSERRNTSRPANRRNGMRL